MASPEDIQSVREVGEVLTRKPLNEAAIVDALKPFLYQSKRGEMVPHIVQYPNFLNVILHIAETMCPREVATCALICLVNLAMFPASHKALLDGNALGIALQNLHLLRDEAENDELDCGLSSASLIIRLVGNQESGPGPEAIKGNPVLVRKLAWVLKSVLDTGMCLGFRWDPANILMDVSTLAKSDRNKPLLSGFVPLLAQAVDQAYNYRAVKYSVLALGQLMFDEGSRVEIQKHRDALRISFSRINLDLHYPNEPDKESLKRSIAVFLASMEDLGKPAKRPSVSSPPQSQQPSRPGRLANLVRGKTSALKTMAANSTQHVMISYQWDVQPLAKDLEQRLSRAGFKTWFDLNDMGSNINDSMAFAVENSWLMIVLFSRRYKESANCRKECEMGDNLQRPMLFVKVEEDYVQEAWLALVMGKALWIAYTDIEQADEAWPQIERRVRQTAGSGTNALPPPASAPAPAPAPSKPKDKDVLQTLLTLVLELKQENAEMKQTLAEIKQKLLDK